MRKSYDVPTDIPAVTTLVFTVSVNLAKAGLCGDVVSVEQAFDILDQLNSVDYTSKFQ